MAPNDSLLAGRAAPASTIRRRLIIALVMVIYLALVVARAATESPFVDEAWYAMPAWDLAMNGSTGTPVIETSDSPMPTMKVSLQGIRRHTYWVMILPVLAQAGWFKLFGFSLLTTRLFSTLCAAVALLVWFMLMKQLSGSATVAAGAVVLIGTDFVFLGRAAFGRVDLMSAAFGISAVFAYLRLRQRSLAAAIVVANALTAAAGLSHPNGGLISLAGLLALILFLDRRALQWRHVLLAAVPYVAGGLLMAVYIMQAPADFAAQFLGQSTGRFGGWTAVPALIPREAVRWVQVYGLNTPSAAGKLKLMVLAAYICGVALVCASRQSRASYRILLVLAAACLTALTFCDNFKVQWYVIYVIPMLCALTVIGALSLSRGHKAAQIGLAGLVVLNLVISTRLTLRNTYSHEYSPMIAFLEKQPRDATIMGSSEIGFGYGFRSNLIDDIRLGYHSGVHPALVVMDDRYRTALAAFEKSEPAVYRYAEGYLHDQCRQTFTSGPYIVYACRG